MNELKINIRPYKRMSKLILIFGFDVQNRLDGFNNYILLMNRGIINTNIITISFKDI